MNLLLMAPEKEKRKQVTPKLLFAWSFQHLCVNTKWRSLIHLFGSNNMVQPQFLTRYHNYTTLSSVVLPTSTANHHCNL